MNFLKSHDAGSAQTILDHSPRVPRAKSSPEAPPLVVILGAGPPYRGVRPSALSPMPDHRRVLDWIFDAFSSAGAAFHYVGGYRAEEVARLYGDFSFSINAEWQFTGNVASLFVAPLSAQRTCYVCYSDVVFRRGVADRLGEAEGDVVLAVDRTWARRYEGRAAEDLHSAEKVKVSGHRLIAIGSELKVHDADAEFVGLVRFSPAAMRQIMSLRETAGNELRHASLPTLIEALMGCGLHITIVDVAGDWAELNAPQDLARFVLGTKAETLERLRPLVRESVIGKQVRLTRGDWQTAREPSIDQVVRCFGATRIIVRSSALTEDSWVTANAGAFLSLPDIDGGDRVAIAEAIDRVFDSYGDHHQNHQVLVQEMVTDVRISGVALTRSLDYGAPYYKINYDDTTCGTHSVTSGSGRSLKTLVMHRNCVRIPDEAPGSLQSLVAALHELEELVGHDSLDVEFAITGNQACHILQLRPIAVDHSDRHATNEGIDTVLAGAIKAFRAKQAPSPFVRSGRAFFGIMPDWNPAEIIGTNPRRLAVSLYRHLVTDEVWAAQRAAYGYHDVRPQPLMVLFAGQPYIDIRASFNSFVPATLCDGLAERLVDHYLDYLAANPHLHDKVEFEIAFTCLTLDFDERAQRLRDAGFSSADVSQLREALRQITRQAFYRCDDDMAQIRLLESRFERTMEARLGPLDRAFVLLEDCRRYGTLPFSHLARSAFVGVSLLRSAAAGGGISSEDVSAFLGSLRTVATQLSHDAREVVAGRLSWGAFVERYGHLRPGTYDITLSSYSEDPERFLRPIVEKAGHSASGPDDGFAWRPGSRQSMRRALRGIGLPDDMRLLDRFLRRAIEGREYAKFAFTRNLNAALHALAEFGAGFGLSREELSHIPLEHFRMLRDGHVPPAIGHWLRAHAQEGERWHDLGLGIELPPLLTRADDFYRFLYPETQPNFVSSGKITGQVFRLSDGAEPASALAGKIVLIPQADPGYDWILGHALGGLITAYGGANSHMAIRAAEFRLPAAIGVGQTLYDRLAHSEVICLDCQNRRIEIVR